MTHLQVIAREDKGPIGGIDYNRSPTVYFETDAIVENKQDLHNNTNHVEPNNPELDSTTEYAQTFCKRITSLGENSRLPGKMKDIGGNTILNTKDNKVISSVLSWLSSRLDSIEALLASIACPLR